MQTYSWPREGMKKIITNNYQTICCGRVVVRTLVVLSGRQNKYDLAIKYFRSRTERCYGNK